MTVDYGSYAPRWRGIRDAPLTVGGAQLHAITAGPSEAETVHLLIHGLGGSCLSWLEVIPHLAVDSHVVAIDLPGFGRSPLGGRRPSVAGYVDVVHALVRDHADRRVVLHGNSLGGLLSLRVAHRTPGRVTALVLAAPAVPMSARRTFPLPTAGLRGLGTISVPGVGERVVGRATRQRGSFANDALRAAVFADADRLLQPEFGAAYASELERFRTDPDARRALLATTRSVLAATISSGAGWAALADEEIPTLVLWGQQDHLLPRGMLSEIQRRRPGWEVVLLPGAAHVPQFDVPEIYAQLALRHTSSAVRAIDAA